MTNKKLISRMPKVLENLGPGAIQILDFRFRILDLKTVRPLSLKFEPVSIRNPNSKIQN
jgi:hypothetical protein